jgi:hypothetical protein
MASQLHVPRWMPLALLQRHPAPLVTASMRPRVHETELDRLLKLIPTELVAFYAAAVPIASELAWRYLAFALFVGGVALVPVILYLDGRSTGQVARWPQYMARTLGFVVWAMAVNWPFSPWISIQHMSWFRSLAVLIVPFASAMLLRDRSPTAAAIDIHVKR